MARVLLAVVAVAATSAWAQGAGNVREGEAPAIAEIERGFYLGVTAGPLFLLNPPATSGPRPFSPGQMAQVEVGRDFGDRVSVALWVMGSANRAGSDYTGKSNGVASGDFSALVPGAVARVNLLGLLDSQEVRRTWVYLRAGAGYAFFSPVKLIPDPDILVFGSVGVEYYTRLRHFSVGLDVGPTMLVTNGTIGFAISPNLRYAF